VKADGCHPPGAADLYDYNGTACELSLPRLERILGAGCAQKQLRRVVKWDRRRVCSGSRATHSSAENEEEDADQPFDFHRWKRFGGVLMWFCRGFSERESFLRGSGNAVNAIDRRDGGAA
jgi:hypothetical protein